MGAATVLSGGLGATMGAITAISESKNKKKIANEIRNMKAPALTNVADGLQVSTRGTDLQAENQARLAATQTGALQDAGSRALVGGISRVAANNNAVNSEIAANLDAQQKDIDMVRAQDDVRIQNTKEQRNVDKINALSSQYNAANQNQQMGMGNALAGVGIIGNSPGKTVDKTVSNGNSFRAPSLSTSVPDSIGWKPKTKIPVVGTTGFKAPIDARVPNSIGYKPKKY